MRQKEQAHFWLSSANNEKSVLTIINGSMSQKLSTNLKELSTNLTFAADFSKVIQKIVHGQIQEYLHKNKILYRYQSGFRPCHSTDTCLSDLSDKIAQGFESSMFTGMILIDLRKAFDTIDHEKFFSKK